MSVTLDLFCILRASRMLVNIFTYHSTVHSRAFDTLELTVSFRVAERLGF